MATINCRQYIRKIVHTIYIVKSELQQSITYTLTLNTSRDKTSSDNWLSPSHCASTSVYLVEPLTIRVLTKWISLNMPTTQIIPSNQESTLKTHPKAYHPITYHPFNFAYLILDLVCWNVAKMVC